MKLYGNPEKKGNIRVCIFCVGLLVFSISLCLAIATYHSNPLLSKILSTVIVFSVGIIMSSLVALIVDTNVTRLNQQLDLLEEEGSADDIISFGYFKHGINLADPESILSLGCDPKRLGRFILSYLHIQCEEVRFCLSGKSEKIEDEINNICRVWIRMIAYAVFEQEQKDDDFSEEFFDGCEMSRHSDLYYRDIGNEFTLYRIGYDTLRVHLSYKWDSHQCEVRHQAELHKKLGISA